MFDRFRFLECCFFKQVLPQFKLFTKIGLEQMVHKLSLNILKSN